MTAKRGRPKGIPMSAEWRAQASVRMMGNQNLLGYRHSDETKEKISLANIGNTYGTSLKGKPKSLECRAKMSKALLGNRRGAGRIGLHLSEEAKNKISAKWHSRPANIRHGKHEDGFRSSWEKKVSEWMTVQGWNWRYEEKRYPIGNRHYTPDFHVYQDGVLLKIIEVKGWWRPGAFDKVRLFKEQYPELPFELWNGPILKQMGILKRL